MDMNGLDEREEKSRVALDCWLRLNVEQNFSWTPETCDPPDIWLKIDDTVFGVEFTSIHGNSPSGIPGQTVANSLGQIGETIAKETMAKLEILGSPLRHYYILSLGPDWTGNKINRKNITNYFVDAISTHYIGFVSGEYDSDKRLLDVKPSHNMLSGIGFYCIGPKDLDEDCWKPNIIPLTEPFGRLPEMGDGQTPFLVANAVNSKIEKMLNNCCPKPWILVVEDNYSWGEDQLQKYLPEGSKEFSAIFRTTRHGATLEYGSVS